LTGPEVVSGLMRAVVKPPRVPLDHRIEGFPSIFTSCSFAAHGGASGTIGGARHEVVDAYQPTPPPDEPHRSDV
jgi:hypothetical protein